MHVSYETFLANISGFLGSYYIIIALMNAIAALFCWKQLKRGDLALTWTIVAIFFVVLSPLAYSGSPQVMKIVSIPEGVRSVIDTVTAQAWLYTLGTTAILAFMYFFRRFLCEPHRCMERAESRLAHDGFVDDRQGIRRDRYQAR